MGRYINAIEGDSMGTSFKEKCNTLIKHGAVAISDTKFVNNMVCVVDNGLFAAAGYAHSEDEYKSFKHPCGRPKRWFILKNANKYAL